MNYNKYQRIKLQKKLNEAINRDFPRKHRKNYIRKLATTITREEKNNLNSPMDYNKNKPRQI
ncbi:hypothetical protein LCGC14_1107270 [marine sediment metagenome]|uniref:Uncharacterized protein n=1 Tax=marine sediment metagenome TaxID=412755 RepID=A0A0F9M7T1_9ZZZZ